MLVRKLYLGSWAALAALLAVGCQMESGPTADASAARARGATAGIPAAVLSENGLMTVWLNPAQRADEGVYLAEILGDNLFIATSPAQGRKGQLKAIQKANGLTHWYKEIEVDEPLKLAPTIYRYPSGATSTTNELYYSQLDTVYCLDLRYGDVLWKQSLDFPISTRIAADELDYFVGSDNGRVYGLKKNSKIDDWPYRTGNVLKATPLADGTNVFAASTDGAVYRLSGRTGWVPGGPSWKFTTGNRIFADPVGYSRWVIVGSTDYKLYCLEATDGSRFWSFSAEAPIEDTPVVFSYRTNQEYVYCIATDQNPGRQRRTLFSVKLSNGEEQWRLEGVRKVVSMGKSALYVINDPKPGEARALVALDVLTGKEKFRIPVEGFRFFPTNLADYGRNLKERGRVYLVAEDGTIQVIGEKL